MSTSNNRWDELSKSLADSIPRRQSLRWFGAAIAGAILSPLGLATAWAGPKACKDFCRCSKKKDQAQCLKACKAANNHPSRLCGECGSYFGCGNGQACCGDYCADLGHDIYNCGACGQFCEAGPNEYGVCVDGACEYECVDGAVYCEGTCTLLEWDANNCGECGNVCEEQTPYCNWGTCEACPAGLTLCGESCVDLAFDDANCGACGNVCEEGLPCDQGVCNPCFGGQALCDGVCTEIQLDPSNCGACGVVCGPGENCAGGQCVPAEPPGDF